MKMRFLKTSATNRPLIGDNNVYVDRYRKIPIWSYRPPTKPHRKNIDSNNNYIRIAIIFDSADERYIKKAFLPIDNKDYLNHFPHLGNKGYMVPQK